MRKALIGIAVLCLAGPVFGQTTNGPQPNPGVSPDEQYVLGPDSRQQPGIPQGEVRELEPVVSKIYPGVQHKWWLYIPAQYDGSKPIALMIFQDGAAFVKRDGKFPVPTVLDNLIAKKELPVMAAIFINPGVPLDNPSRRTEERSFEYDTLSAQYARFLLEEAIPQVRKAIKITDDPNGRGIAGFSSGGICAFTVAWQRPKAFRKVFSAVGSFVNIRGGGVYPDLIQQSAKKPIRVFLQDGINDALGGPFAGLNWPEGNRHMTAALAFKGYDYQFVMGTGIHSYNHAAALFPDAMRWLWRDYRR